MRPEAGPYSVGLERNDANFRPLTPLGFLDWSASVFPDRLSVVHGDRRFTWRETRRRATALASALRRRGIGRGQTVSAMLANTPEMYECHFGVPMIGAVLNTLNTRLDADAIAFMLDHGEARAVVTDREFAPVVAAAVKTIARPILVVDVNDPEYAGPGDAIGEIEYEALLATGSPDEPWAAPDDEWDPITLNYTSGTTGNPKGVVYSHRGAYLCALGNILTWSLPRHPVYLWTLPMFHCNGWTFPWAIAALAGTNVCLRRVDAQLIASLMKRHGVTHYCGAPIVHNTLASAPAGTFDGLPNQVQAMVAAAAPPAATLAAMDRLGIEMTHVYGLTEVYGPATECAKHEAWRALAVEERAALNARQGVRYVLQEDVDVLDPVTMEPVPRDGTTIGEIMFRGNMTMKGYLKNETATREAFAGGWFHTGDLAVVHPDGYIKIRDRAKDVIISGGENISSLEVEDAICFHPAVAAVAVVAQPDPRWGESPCAFVELRPGAQATEAEIIDHCRQRLAHFKAPRQVVFGPLPKTSTGKIQKFVLRDRARSAEAIE